MIPVIREACGRSPQSELREVVRLAGPATLHMALVALTFVGDRALLGAHPSAMAALHLPATITWCLVALVSAVGIGAFPLVGRSHGARCLLERSAAIQASLSLARRVGLAAVPLSLVLGLLLLPSLSPPLRAQAGGYLVIVSAALPLAAIEAAAAASLQAMGDTKRPLFYAGAGSALHLAATAVGARLGFGLEGAALGTVAGFALSGIGNVRALGAAIHAPLPRLTLARARAELWAIVMPAASEKIGYLSGYLAYAAAIASLGPIAMAANQTLLAFEAIAYPVAEGCGIAAASLVAQRLGGRDGRRARLGFSLPALIAVGLAMLFGIAAVAMPGACVRLTAEDPEVAALAVRVIPWLAISQPAMALALVGAMALRGAGEVRSAMLVTLAGTALRLTLVFALGGEQGFGLEAAWVASAADWWLQATLVLWLVARRFGHTGAAVAA